MCYFCVVDCFDCVIFDCGLMIDCVIDLIDVLVDVCVYFFCVCVGVID